LEKVTEDGIKSAIKQYKHHENDTEKNPINDVLDDIQSHLKCCGATEPADWQLNDYFNRTGGYPYSCCPQQEDKNHTHTDCTDPKKLFPDRKDDHNLSNV